MHGALILTSCPDGLLPLSCYPCRGQADTIKSIGKFFGPVPPAAQHTPVTVQDVADSAAAILTNPAPHVGKTYSIAGPSFSNADAAAAFTATLGKPVEYVQVPYDAAEASFLEKGWPAWQVKGLLELLRGVEAGEHSFPSDVKALTGRDATTVQQWVSAVGAGFQ